MSQIYLYFLLKVIVPWTPMSVISIWLHAWTFFARIDRKTDLLLKRLFFYEQILYCSLVQGMIHIFQKMMHFSAPDLLQGWYSFARCSRFLNFIATFCVQNANPFHFQILKTISYVLSRSGWQQCSMLSAFTAWEQHKPNCL